MFGSGANSVMKFNRGQVAKRKKFGEITETRHEKHKELVDKQMSASQFERFKQDLKEKRRMESFKIGLTLFVITFAVTTAFILVLR